MSNVLGNYDPNFYAAQALVQLEKVLGMAARVYRGYDKEPQQLGSVINLRRPTYFSAQAMPISTSNTTDLNTDSVAITLDQWHGVQFSLTDKELAYASERIVNEHIRPAAVAMADKIDQSVNSLAASVPWYYVGQNVGTATNQITDIPALRRRLFDNLVPTSDIHLELNGEREQYFLSCDTFNRYQNAGSVDTQERGTLGEKFGFEIFANQNVQAEIAGGTIGTATGTLATATIGATSLSITGVGASDTIKAGDIIQAGHTGTDGLSGVAFLVGSGQGPSATRNFVATANATATSSAITVNVSPSVHATIAAGTTVTFKTQSSSKYDNLAFHRNAFALAMAPLPETARQMGAMVATVTDPISGLSLRSTMWYQGADAKVYIRIDALWGRTVLNPDMAVRYIA